MLYLGPSPISTTSQPFSYQQKEARQAQHLMPEAPSWGTDAVLPRPFGQRSAHCASFMPLLSQERWPPAPVHRWGAPTQREGVRLEAFRLVHLFCGFVMISSSCLFMSDLNNSGCNFSMNVHESQQEFPTKQKTSESNPSDSGHQLNARSLWPRAIPMLASQLQLLYVGWQIIVATSGNTSR